MSKEQREVFLDDGHFKLLSGGEGSGKSYMGALYAIVCAIIAYRDEGGSRKIQVWIVGKDYEDARKEASYINGENSDGVDWLNLLGIFDVDGSSWPADPSSRVYINTTWGITFETISAYDAKKIGRDQPDVIIGAEVSRWEGEIYSRIMGRFVRRPNCRVWLSGSPDGTEGWFPEVFNLGQVSGNPQGVTSYPLAAWANPDIYEFGFDDPKVAFLMEASPDMAYFWERYGGIPQKPKDAVLPEFKTIFHVNADLEVHTELPVHIAIDPGHRIYCLLFVQFVGNEIWVLDELYVPQASHEAVIQQATTNKLWQFIDPSDVHVMDVAGKQSHGGRKNAHPIEAWFEDTGIRFKAKKWDVRDQLDRLRTVLMPQGPGERPYLQIHPRCKGLIAEAGGGPSPVENGGRWRLINGLPDTSQKAFDHAWKALSYLLLTIMGAKKPGFRKDDGEPVTYTRAPEPDDDWDAWNPEGAGADNYVGVM